VCVVVEIQHLFFKLRFNSHMPIMEVIVGHMSLKSISVNQFVGKGGYLVSVPSQQNRIMPEDTRVYTKVSGLAARSENFK
jgi:hypothetical protein